MGIAAYSKFIAPMKSFTVERAIPSTVARGQIRRPRDDRIYESKSPLRIATANLGKARSFAAIPMMSGDQLIDVFTVYRNRVHPFNLETAVDC